MHVPTRIFLLRVIDERMQEALQRPIATRRVGVEPTARLDGEVGCLLDRLHREIPGRLDNHCPLATDPGDDGRSVFVIMAPPRLAFLPAPTRSTPQVLFPSVLSLPLVARGMVEVIRFNDAFQLAMHLIGHGGIAQPPAPPIARADMDTQFSRDAPGRTRET